MQMKCIAFELKNKQNEMCFDNCTKKKIVFDLLTVI